MLHQTRKKLPPVARDSVVRCLLDDKHVFLATDSSNWVTIIVGFRYRFYGALMLDTHKMIHYMYLGGVKWQHSLLPVVGVEPATSTVAAPESCCAQCEIVLPGPSLELPGGAWQLILSRHVIFVVAPSSVFPRVAVGYVFWAQGLNTIRAQSTCQKLSLSVPIMGPLLVPRFGAKKMSPHSGKHILGPVFEYAFGS